MAVLYAASVIPIIGEAGSIHPESVLLGALADEPKAQHEDEYWRRVYAAVGSLPQAGRKLSPAFWERVWEHSSWKARGNGLFIYCQKHRDMPKVTYPLMKRFFKDPHEKVRELAVICFQYVQKPEENQTPWPDGLLIEIQNNLLELAKRESSGEVLREVRQVLPRLFNPSPPRFDEPLPWPPFWSQDLQKTEVNLTEEELKAVRNAAKSSLALTLMGPARQLELQSEEAVVADVHALTWEADHFVLTVKIPGKDRFREPETGEETFSIFPFLLIRKPSISVVCLVGKEEYYYGSAVKVASLVGKDTHQILVREDISWGNSGNATKVSLFHWNGKNYRQIFREQVQGWGNNTEQASGQLGFDPKRKAFLVQKSRHSTRNWFQDEYQYPVKIPPIVTFQPVDVYQWDGRTFAKQREKDGSIQLEWLALKRAIALWYLGDETQRDAIQKALVHPNYELASDARRLYNPQWSWSPAWEDQRYREMVEETVGAQSR